MAQEGMAVAWLQVEEVEGKEEKEKGNGTSMMQQRWLSWPSSSSSNKKPTCACRCKKRLLQEQEGTLAMQAAAPTKAAGMQAGRAVQHQAGPLGAHSWTAP